MEKPPALQSSYAIYDLFLADERTDKVDLTVGIFRNDDLSIHSFGAIRAAKKLLAAHYRDDGYLPFSGDHYYTTALTKLIFGSIERPHFSMQAIGGTGALRLVGDYLATLDRKTIYIPSPSWTNHTPLFQACGLHCSEYSYYANCELQFDSLMDCLKKAKAGDAFLFHAVCHNPTGRDYSEGEWRAISKEMKERGLIPVFDSAYHGYHRGVDEDLFAIRHFLEEGHEMFVAYSCSKTFGVYGERVGLTCAVSPQWKEISEEFKRASRHLYSNPPRHGSLLVKNVLMDEKLRGEWEKELSMMRKKLGERRTSLLSGLRNMGCPVDYLEKQHGFFCMVDISIEMAKRLREEFAVYMLENGRINLSSLNRENLPRVIQALGKTLLGK